MAAYSIKNLTSFLGKIENVILIHIALSKISVHNDLALSKRGVTIQNEKTKVSMMSSYF